MVMDKKTSQIFCITTLLFTGVIGLHGHYVSDRYIYAAAGGHVSLPCTGMLIPGCRDTVWNYTSPEGETLEVVTVGKVRTDITKRAGKMSVDEDCVLNIANVTAEDTGEYYCGPGGEEIYLSVLDISASPSISNNGTDGDVTLSCHLHTHEGCEKASSTDKINLSWIDEEGSTLQESADRQIQNPSACHTTLKESRLHQEKTWKCQLTTRWGSLKIVAKYTMLATPIPDPTEGFAGFTRESDKLEKANEGKSTASLGVIFPHRYYFWDRYIYAAAGGHVSLTCADMYITGCGNFRWNYTSPQGETVELMTVEHKTVILYHTPPSETGGVGEVREVRSIITKRPEKMTVDENCVLNIANVTAEDTGEYYCGPGGGETYLSVLDISASPSISNNGTDGDVTLSCHLHTHEGCEKASSTDMIHLSWIDEEGSPLQKSSDRQIQNPSACHTTIKESHLHQREKTWRCQLTARWGWRKIVAKYTMLATPTPDPTEGSVGFTMESDKLEKTKKEKSTAFLATLPRPRRLRRERGN
ncbi:uncharacterized protein LOC143109619 [Alosa pseudoharengus]|uniref:uncharacterized protein LOC143109619 n=1 Tax=Alosa pseudoharengus TaxID=34774 RepID=UPI003F8AA838